jgi:hypothetical protein
MIYENGNGNVKNNMAKIPCLYYSEKTVARAIASLLGEQTERLTQPNVFSDKSILVVRCCWRRMRVHVDEQMRSDVSEVEEKLVSKQVNLKLPDL